MSNVNSRRLSFQGGTWRDIARLSILTDALTELMFSKVDYANILRGYRTGGHPNSKEAQRLR
jgi:hypothetical protein